MRIWLWLALCLPLTAAALPYPEARHLLVRTGFGPTEAEITALADLDYAQAVDAVLAATGSDSRIPPPDWVDTPPPDRAARRSLDDTRKQQRREQLRDWNRELKGWWYREMAATDAPLTERMTLFWHNHFTSSTRKVHWVPFMYQQNRLFRKHATGNFAELLHAVARDPAMLLYLDNARSHAGNPNENFARELLELFTLGEGHYSEDDIKAAARAFTGWTLDRDTGKFRFAQRRHDDGEKTFLGRRGHWDGDDILRIILEQPRTAVTITTRLWREFVSLQPDEREIQRIAAVFRDSGYEVKPLLEALLTCRTFRDPANRGSLIKSPVELLVGSVRMLDIPLQDGSRLVRAGRLLGQDIFDPPNVKGWAGGTAWIDSASLLNRQMILSRIARLSQEQAVRRRAAQTAPPEQWLLAVPPTAALPESDPTRRLSALLHDPAYQLK